MLITDQFSFRTVFSLVDVVIEVLERTIHLVAVGLGTTIETLDLVTASTPFVEGFMSKGAGRVALLFFLE
jgi:hypothetical protein